MNSINYLPTVGLRGAISFLDETEKGALACASRKCAILASNDPSRSLDSMNARRVQSIGKVSRYLHRGPTEAYIRELPNFEINNQNNSLHEQINWIRWEINVIGDSSLNERLNTFSFRNRDAWIEWRYRFDPAAERAVREIVETENRHGGYVPLYHACQKSTFCFSLFTRELLSAGYSNTKEMPLNAPLIRFPNPEGPKTIEEFFQRYRPSSDDQNPIVYDHRPEIIQELLPVNPHLFMNYYNPNECSWFYYLHDKNVCAPGSDSFFRNLCINYGLNPSDETLRELMDLHLALVDCSERYMAALRPDFALFSRGVILQFLVPEELIEKVTYTCQDCGYLDRDNRPILQRLNDPKKRQFQARLLVQSLFVPDHKIKTFIHGCGDFFSDRIAIPERDQILASARLIFEKLVLDSILKKNPTPTIARVMPIGCDEL